MRYLFVTTENLAVNPRLVKELRLAESLGFDCDCVLANFPPNHWSNKISKSIEETFTKVHFIHFETKRSLIFNWIKYTLKHHYYKLLSWILPKNVKIGAFASSKRGIQINDILPKRNKYDLVIAHVIGALFPAWDYARKKHFKFACDIEDYHPGECLIESKDHHEIHLRELILKKVLSDCIYASFAAPLIREECKKLLCLNNIPEHWQVILNSFDENEFIRPQEHKKSNKLEVVWFSQNISIGRGLELLLPVFKELEKKVHLTLIGNLNSNFYETFLKKIEDIITIKPIMKQNQLYRELMKYDCGLACEITESNDFNRTLCLTNKILSYCQAGLYVLGTDTKAQIQFLKDHPLCGAIFKSTQCDFKDILLNLYDNLDNIRNNAYKRWEYSKSFSWQNQQNMLINEWDIINQ